MTLRVRGSDSIVADSYEDYSCVWIEDVGPLLRTTSLICLPSATWPPLPLEAKPRGTESMRMSGHRSISCPGKWV